MKFNLLSRLQRWILVTGLFFLVLMLLARLGLYWYFRPAGTLPGKSMLSVFWTGARYDLREIGILCLLMLVLGSFRALNPFRSALGKRSWLILLLVAGIVWVIFYTFDAAHFAYLTQRLNASALSFLQDANISMGMIWETYPVVKILLGMIILAALIYGFARYSYRKISQVPDPPAKKRNMVSFLVLFLLFAVCIFGRIGQFPLRWSDAFSLGNDFKAQIALNPFQSFFSSMAFRHSSFNTAKAKQYYPAMAAYLGVQHPDSAQLNYERYSPARDSALHTRPNIVLVICESFSAYKSSLWGNPLNTTPFINTMAGESLFFDHCFTPSFGTARGVWAVITGLPDVAVNKTSSRNPQLVDQHTIINAFKGYDHFYFIGGSTSWANVRGLIDNNIDSVHIYEEKDYSSPRLDVWGISDKDLFTEANKVFRQEQRPFFAIVQTSDNHRPYSIPQEDLQAFHKVSYPLDTLKRYGFFSNDEINAFRYFDFCVQHFITTARKEAYFNNTIFAFVGDHGIYGDAGNMFPRAWSDERLTSEHVPLIFYSPALIAPQRRNMICSQVDILPTIAGLAGVSYHNYTLGRDLMSITDTTGSMAFIIEQDNRQMGLIRGDHYLKEEMGSHEDRLVSIRNNDPVPATPRTDTIKSTMQQWMYAFYETARYMGYHNQK